MSNKKRKRKKSQNTGLKLHTISPITDRQHDVFESYYNDYNLILDGSAGTGKTFVAIYLALEEIFRKKSDIKKLIIFRSIVPTRDIGFLKGNLTEKISVYENPYRMIVNKLFECGSAYDSMKGRDIIEFLSTSFNRGITLDNSIILIDEAQNLNDHEISTILTRLGENSKIILCGDTRQLDLNERKEKSGFEIMKKIAYNMEDDFDIVTFTPDDIVRSDLIKRYLIAREKMGL